MRLFVISALIIAFLAILFALQNINLVTIQFFIWQYRQSLALVLLGSLAIGVVIGLLVSFPAIMRRRLKATQIQKQADTLTELVHEKEQAVGAESRKVAAVTQKYTNLLQSLDLIDPVTGLLRSRSLPQVIATQLSHLAEPDPASSPRSLSVLMVKVQPRSFEGNSRDDILLAVARLLQHRASTATWLYSDGEGLFVATTPELDLKSATRYGEELQTAILEHLPPGPTGEAVEVDVSIGGAIADARTTTTDSHQLITTAEKALEQALQRGRNRLRILPV